LMQPSYVLCRVDPIDLRPNNATRGKRRATHGAPHSLAKFVADIQAFTTPIKWAFKVHLRPNPSAFRSSTASLDWNGCDADAAKPFEENSALLPLHRLMADELDAAFKSLRELLLCQGFEQNPTRHGLYARSGGIAPESNTANLIQSNSSLTLLLAQGSSCQGCMFSPAHLSRPNTL